MKNWILVFFLFFSSVTLSAQKKILTVSQDGAMIYQAPNFDANILSYLSAGDKLTLLSTKRYSEYFLYIKTEKGVKGYISSVDTVGGVVKKAKGKKKVSKSKSEEISKPRRAVRDMDSSAYFGLGVERIEFREKTGGDFHKQFLSATALRFLGPDFLMSGDLQTEMNVALYTKTPEYYEDMTGESSGSGLLLLMDFLAVTPFDLTRSSMTYFGFGPLIRHSSFNVQTSIGGKSSSYNLTNINLGFAFEIGYMYRINRVALRFDWKYYWEKMQHNGLGLSLMYEL